MPIESPIASLSQVMILSLLPGNARKVVGLDVVAASIFSIGARLFYSPRAMPSNCLSVVMFSLSTTFE